MKSYLDARLDFSIVELPKEGNDEQVRLVYSIIDEGRKVFVNQIVISGVTGSANTRRTKRAAIRRAIPIAAKEMYSGQIDPRKQNANCISPMRIAGVIIRTEAAGETATGLQTTGRRSSTLKRRSRDVMDYGGGYSTDAGALGLFEISDVNLMSRLRHGAMRLRASRRSNLCVLNISISFLPDRDHKFAPLAASVEYQRDSTITRFFRSAIDRGTMGIVQRLDEDGNPIDIFGNKVNEPTINRFTAVVETQRVLDQKGAHDPLRAFQLRRCASVQSREFGSQADSGTRRQDPASAFWCLVRARYARAV